MKTPTIYRISHPSKIIKGHLHLSSSKSLSNRLLIIKEVGKLNVTLQNLASSKDTETLINLLKQLNTSKTFDVGHAGTTMRFLTALFANIEGERILTGSARMKERPIRELVNSLRLLGADIEYLETDGYPPINIKGKILTGGKIKMKGNISSQYISALLLISPLLSSELEIEFEGELVSRPYIDMTIQLMKDFGSIINWESNGLRCLNQAYHDNKKELSVEADWSSASYLYSIMALCKNGDLQVDGLSANSLQADAVSEKLFQQFGVETYHNSGIGITLTKKDASLSSFNFDFSDCPDIAQTLAVVAGVLNKTAYLGGLQTLKIKETDRIVALQNELKKIGIETEANNDSLRITKAVLQNRAGSAIKTYHDHRMALAFAPLALVMDYIDIVDPSVVEKSYPEYWIHLQQLGFIIEPISA